jgi:hypothetical protein
MELWSKKLLGEVGSRKPPEPKGWVFTHFCKTLRLPSSVKETGKQKLK